MTVTSLVPGIFSQDLCNVTLYFNLAIAFSQTLACEAGVLSTGETVEVKSGPLQLQASLNQSYYNVTIQLLSSSSLVNGELVTVLQLKDPPKPNSAEFLVAWLWLLAS